MNLVSKTASPHILRQFSFLKNRNLLWWWYAMAIESNLQKNVFWCFKLYFLFIYIILRQVISHCNVIFVMQTLSLELFSWILLSWILNFSHFRVLLIWPYCGIILIVILYYYYLNYGFLAFCHIYVCYVAIFLLGFSHIWCLLYCVILFGFCFEMILIFKSRRIWGCDYIISYPYFGKLFMQICQIKPIK